MNRVDAPLQRSPESGGRCVVCEAALEDGRCHECGSAQRPGGYEVLRELSRSPHGRVYLARAPDGAKVALKELVFALAPDARQIDAFEREAATLGALRHPGIPRFVASFREGSGVHLRLYVAQEFVEGESLEQRVTRDGPLPEAEALRIAGALLEILTALHDRHPPCVHRDLKPANVLVTPEGQVRLVDFGAAREVVRGQTHGATLVGTFGYMPPEQMGGTVSPASDLYALGATLLHLLSGVSPAELLSEDLTLALARAPRVPEHWRPFLTRLLERKPSERYASAEQARSELPGTSTRPLRRSTAPKPLLAAVAGMVAVLTVLAGTVLIAAPRGAPIPAPPPQVRPRPLPASDTAKLFEQLAQANTSTEKYALLQQLHFGSAGASPRTPEQEELLVALTRDDSEEVRALALKVLGDATLVSPRSLDVLIDRMLHGRPEANQVAATDALAREVRRGLSPDSQQRAVGALLDALEQAPAGMVMVTAGNALQGGKPLTPEAIARLRGLLRDQTVGRREQAFAILLGHLVELPKNRTDALELLKAGTEQQRHFGLALLSREILSTEEVDRLAEFGQHETRTEARADALRVLSDAGLLQFSQKGMAFVVSSLTDKDKGVRAAAIEVFRKSPMVSLKYPKELARARAAETDPELASALDRLLAGTRSK